MPDGLIAGVARGTQAAVDGFLTVLASALCPTDDQDHCLLSRAVHCGSPWTTGLAVGTSVMMAAADGEQRMMGQVQSLGRGSGVPHDQDSGVFCLIDISYLIFSSPGG
jgi:hypothetical protein